MTQMQQEQPKRLQKSNNVKKLCYIKESGLEVEVWSWIDILSGEIQFEGTIMIWHSSGQRRSEDRCCSFRKCCLDQCKQVERALLHSQTNAHKRGTVTPRIQMNKPGFRSQPGRNYMSCFVQTQVWGTNYFLSAVGQTWTLAVQAGNRSIPSTVMTV